MANVIWSPRANRQLGTILSIISKEAGETVAIKWNRRFLKASRILEKFPEIGSPVEEIPIPGLREQIIGPFRMIFHFNGSAVHIVFVVRAERDLERVLMETGLLT